MHLLQPGLPLLALVLSSPRQQLPGHAGLRDTASLHLWDHWGCRSQDAKVAWLACRDVCKLVTDQVKLLRSTRTSLVGEDVDAWALMPFAVRDRALQAELKTEGSLHAALWPPNAQSCHGHYAVSPRTCSFLHRPTETYQTDWFASQAGSSGHSASCSVAGKGAG